LLQKRLAQLAKYFREKYPHTLFTGFWLFAVILASLSSLFAQPSTPESAVADPVQGFYRFHFAHDMGFTPDSVKARSAWLSPALLKICVAYFASPSAPDEVPVINGDPFTNSQEYPNSFQVGTPSLSNSTALIPVSFQWPDGRKRSLSVALVVQNQKWLIDNIRYPDGSSLRSLIAKNKR
jgi:hypothetical protein